MHHAPSLARVAILLFLLPFLPHAASAAPPLKIFLLAGQSNMEGHVHIRTIEHLAMQEGHVIQVRCRLSQLKDSLVLHNLLRHSGRIWIGYRNDVYLVVVRLFNLWIA